MIQVFKNRELALQIALTDFKLRYENSALGFIWALLEPLCMMVIMWFVFARVVRIKIPNYQLFLLIGLLMWNFFSRGTVQGIRAFTARLGILSKIYFPRSVIIFASCLTNLFFFCMEMVIFLAMMLIFHVPMGWHMLLLIPLFLLEFLLIYSISLFLAPLNLKYGDFGNLWGVLVRVGFYMTPILYSISFISDKMRFYYLLNPMARMISAVRAVIFPEIFLDDDYFWILPATVAVIFVAGEILFKRLEPRFGDYI